MRARSRIVTLAPVLLLIPAVGWCAESVGSTDEEVMTVPGGARAVSRLLGNIDTDPERFAASLNRVLLRVIRADHDWRAVDSRVELQAYLETVAELEALLSFPLELDGLSPESLDRLDTLSSVLGFTLQRNAGPVRIEAREGEDGGRRQRVAWALGWNLTQIAHRIGNGESVTLDLSADHVAPALPLAVWEKITGTRTTSETALAVMVTNQRLGLIVEGAARMTLESRRLLSADDLRWLYVHAPVAFYRYSAAFEIRDGALRLPGGPSTKGAWSEWIGSDPGDWREFMRATLTRSNSVFAHVWSALFFLPKPAARYFVESFIAAPWTDDRVEVALQGIRSVYGRRFFSRALGLGGGLQLLYRAVRFAGDEPSPRIPGSPAVWSVALQDGPVPKSASAASKAASRAGKNGASLEAYLCRWMAKECRIGRSRGLLIERYLETARMFESSPAWSTPENIYLVTRAAGRFLSAVQSLPRMRLRRPESVRDYLVAVARLGEDVGDADRLIRFQGGVELLAVMFEAGTVEDSRLEAALQSWTKLHNEIVSDVRLEVGQAAWLRELLESLPPEGPAAPGRGPLERTWLAAMAGGQEPQAFEWNGLVYEGRRGRDRAARMFQRLVGEGVPPLDEVLDTVARLGELSSRATKLPSADATRLREIFVAPAYLPALSGIENVLLSDQRLVGRHVAVDRRAMRLFPGTGPWLSAEVVHSSAGAGATYIAGHLGQVRDLLIRLHVRSLQPPGKGRQIGLLPREAWWYHDLVGPTWARVSPEALAVVESLVRAGDTIVEKAISELDRGGPALDFVVEQIPRYRLEAAAAASSSFLVTPSDRLALGLAAVEGGGPGGPAHGLLDNERGDEIGRALREVGRGHDGLDAVGAPTPHVNGYHRSRFGQWLPYEAFDREGPLAALVERELVDLRITIALYLSRNDLPGSVGADLERYVIVRASDRLRLESAEDWESVLDWIGHLDDAYFERGMRWCLEQGFYRVRDS